MSKCSTQLRDSGSNPTSPLQNFRVYLTDRKNIKGFIETHHYSHNINGVKSTFCFELTHGKNIVGAMLLGEPATRGVSEHYGKKEKVIEIRRLVCIDDTPKNTESFFIGFVMRWLRKNTNYEIVLSYSDLEYGHEGIIYKASNFRFVGTIPGAVKILWRGKLYHDRSMRVKYKGQFKPFAQKLRDAYNSGQTQNITTKGKNVWVYKLSRQIR